jgi:hypothetical protein
MSMFRKKPIIVEARCFLPGTGQDLVAWCGGREQGDFNELGVFPWIEIPTLEGNMRANPGDWIIRGVKGEFYPCKPGIFDATYEPA